MCFLRKSHRTLAVSIAAAAALAISASPPASAQLHLISNGDFETGDFTGWSVVDRPLGSQYDPEVPAAGSFAIDDAADGVTPISGLSALGPSQGSFYAISDMTAQGTHVLLQDFTVPFDATSVSLSFDMYVYDWYGAGAAIDPAGLDHTTPNPNQHARVDLLIAGSNPFATDAGSVAQNFYLSVDPEAQAGQPPFYRSYTFNLTGVALPGQTYRLRFGVVDNQFVLNQGVDNISVTAASPSAAAAPEPGTGVLLLLTAASGGSLLVARRRCRR